MNNNDIQQQDQERARTHTESQAAAAAHQIGIESQSRAVNSRKHNPNFYDKFTQTDLKDSRKWGHLVDEFRPWLADDHILSNRRQVFRLQAELLNRVRAQQAIAGATPGVRLREKPLLNALAQGINPTLDEPVPLDAAGQSAIVIRDEHFSPPMDANERSAMDDIASIATARQAMGVEKSGSEALTTATTESRTVREDESEEKSTIGSISGVFD